MSIAAIRQFIATTHHLLGAILKDEALLAHIAAASELCIEALRSKKKILIAGNGGSAGDAQHMAAELVSRFYYDRPALAAIALTTDTSAITAIGNDYSFERIFSRQIEALGQAGDVFIAISTSGNSANILAALHTARGLNIKTIGLTGESGGKMAELCDIALKVPAKQTPRIQECHIVLGHAICQIIEDTIFGKDYNPKMRMA